MYRNASVLRLSALMWLAALLMVGCAGEAKRTASCDLAGQKGAKAALEQQGDRLSIGFSGLPVPSRGTVLYSVMAYDEAGETGAQLGVKFQDGEQVAYFVFDSANAQQLNVDGVPTLSDEGLTATFQGDALGPLADVSVASWSAAYTVDGEDIGKCPASGYLPFPG